MKKKGSGFNHENLTTEAKQLVLSHSTRKFKDLTEELSSDGEVK